MKDAARTESGNSTFASRIVELLEAERRQMAERLEKLRSKRVELVTPSQLTTSMESPLASAVKSPGRRRDLYKVALLLREANKINQYLNTNLVSKGESFITHSDMSELIFSALWYIIGI